MNGRGAHPRSPVARTDMLSFRFFIRVYYCYKWYDVSPKLNNSRYTRFSSTASRSPRRPLVHITSSSSPITFACFGTRVQRTASATRPNNNIVVIIIIVITNIIIVVITVDIHSPRISYVTDVHL